LGRREYGSQSQLTVTKWRISAITVRGELELAGTRRPASFELNAGAGRVRGTLPVTQNEWGIKPYRGTMGTLKVRDTLEVVLDVSLPSD
jgi:hypothetical protein